MKSLMRIFLLVVITLGSIVQLSAQDLPVESYIEQYKDVAIKEQKRVGIPAAVKLAQAIHESGAGTSDLAKNAKNHFGLKCKNTWTGDTYYKTDDRPNECFRKYNSEVGSFVDHSNYLKFKPHYASLFDLEVTDYKAWANGLHKAGYATNPKYPELLISIIERFNLQQYTLIALGQVPETAMATTENTEDVVAATVTSTPAQTQTNIDVAGNTDGVKVKSTSDNVEIINELKAVQGEKGDMPLEYAVRNKIRYQKFLELNDLKEEPLPADMPLYLERKHFLGLRPMHIVKEGETMLVIAQREGVQLKYLRDLNLMVEGEEPAPGTTIALQAHAAAKPQLLTDDPDVNKGPKFNITTAGTKPAEGIPTKPIVASAEADEALTIVEAKKKAESEDVEEEPFVPIHDTPTVTKTEKEEIIQKEEVVVASEQEQHEVTDDLISKEEELVVVENEEEPKADIAPPAPPVIKSELDLLKDKFDQIIYSDEPPAETVESVAETDEVTTEVVPDTKQVENEPKDATKYYTVKDGDTAFSIAKEHNISIRELMEWNDLDFDAIEVGQKLKVRQ